MIEVNYQISDFKIVDKSGNHAFSAAISSGNAGWIGSSLVFPVVIYSVGTGYNPRTGIFTAPTAGTYVFCLCSVCQT